jgi:hypothetical protein
MGRNLEWKMLNQRLRFEKILSDYKPLQTVFKNSEPILEKKDIVEETLQSYTYLQSRFSKKD